MRILIIGDSCLDIFVYGVVERICPEAPVPVLLLNKTVVEKGMAWNIEKNLTLMDVDCDLVSYNSPIRKTRFIHYETDHMLLRVDENDIAPSELTKSNVEDINFKDYDGCIISDYGKRFLIIEIMQLILEKCKKNGVMSFLDTKAIVYEWATDASFIKMNRMEYQYSFGKREIVPEVLKDKIILTKGGEGCEYKGKIYPPPENVQVVDPAGAGDVFLAVFARTYLKSKDVEKSIMAAQYYAGKTVQRRGTSLVKEDYNNIDNLF